MNVSTEDEELVKLLDFKDIEVIDAIENNENNANTENCKNCDGQILIKHNHAYVEEKTNGTIAPSTERRSDEPSELSFEKGN